MAALTLRRCAMIPISEGAEAFRDRHCYTLAAGSAEGICRTSGKPQQSGAVIAPTRSFPRQSLSSGKERPRGLLTAVPTEAAPLSVRRHRRG